jgi:predicted dehydrogenase
MRVGIIGCGLVAHKRAGNLGEHRLVACYDVDTARAEALASQHAGARAVDDPRRVFDDRQIDLVFVSTPHHLLAPNALAAIQAGKPVLSEKPGARSVAELEQLACAAAQLGVLVKVGFNHRFHPGLRRAHELTVQGEIGQLMYLRARYGHGGRLGYEREWRADPRVAGGGELLDQGSHLIDLARWFAGDFVEVSGHLATYFWQMPVEDNAFALLKTAAGQVAWLHASWTEWKNLFSFELFGRSGKLQVDGLGGSYGTERLTYYRMLPELGPPETTSWEYPGPDHSWRDEFAHFVACIEHGRPPCGSLDDAAAVLRTTSRLYAGARA